MDIRLHEDLEGYTLKDIGGISFTQREIDVTACILNGRSPKKIAAFLSISPKTVENHIRNIKIKLNCSTQEQVIDFLEASEHLAVIKKHYFNLLGHHKFVSELGRLAPILSKLELKYCIVYNTQDRNPPVLAKKLEMHLNAIHCKTVLKAVDKGQTAPKSQLEGAITIIYIVNDLNDIKLSDFIWNDLDHSKAKIFGIHLGEPFVRDEDTSRFTLSLVANSNYYVLFFDLLSKLLPHINFEHAISLFKHHSVAFQQPSAKKSLALPQAPEDVRLFLPAEKPSSKSKTRFFKNLIHYSVITSAITIGALLIIGLFSYYNFIPFFKNTHKQVENSHSKINTYLGVERKELCKVPKPCEFFYGRVDFLEKIRGYLAKHKKAIVVGYQGVGKTQLSYQFAKKNAENYPGGTYLFRVDSEQSVIDSLRLFSVVIGVLTEAEAYRFSDEQIKTVMIPVLQEHLKTQNRMLFIFDNADSYERIKDLLCLQGDNHHIIITSCSKKWDAWDFLELKEFNREKCESEQLILTVLKQADAQSAKKLADTLGHYPLAIAQAINYLKNNHMITIDEYILEYTSLYERRKAFLSYHPFKQDNYMKTSIAAFEISKNTLIKEWADAYQLLKFCSYFEHNLIPVSLFKSGFKEIHYSLEILNKYSMLDIINIKGELFLNVHNVVRDNTRIQICEGKEDSILSENLINFIDQYIVQDFLDKQNIEKIRLIITHVDDFINYLNKNNSPLLKTKKLVNILNKTGGYYIHCSRDTLAAIRLLEKAKYLMQFIKPDHRLANKILENLAMSYYYHGEYNKAREEIQVIHSKNYLSDLSYIIEGHILYNECRYNEALLAYQKALKILEKNVENQNSALVYRSLGMVFYRKSDHTDVEKATEYLIVSKQYLEKALQIQTGFNSENLEFAITKHAYARVALKLKKIDEAEQYYSDALRMVKDYYKKDEDHYEILVMKRSYGHFLCMHKKERFNEGVTYLREALLGKMRIYKNKPHQAVIGTMELIVDVFSLNPKRQQLSELMPIINQYLDDWIISEGHDQSKNINRQIIQKKIKSMKNVLSQII